jgi:hypothetical protein
MPAPHLLRAMHETSKSARLRAAVAAVSLLCSTLVAGLPAPARAQSFDVPEGFVSEIVRDRGVGGRLSAILRIRPEDGAFSGLSSIEMEPIVDHIADPDQWLKSRMTASFAGLTPDEEGALDSLDSPFGHPVFDELRGAVAALMAKLRELGSLPLELCDEPRGRSNGAGAYREMSCRFALGPLTKHVVLRLQELDGLWYYTVIRTMNERRLRHLLAIANSFHLE